MTEKKITMVASGKANRKKAFTVTVLFLFLAIATGSPYFSDSEGAIAATASSRKKVEKKPKLDVGYQPTPYEIAKEMIGIADVRKDDLVYDLGCGDGRIVIMAAKEKGAKGIGVDLDPQRIKESEENARKAGVTGRVRFFRQDLFTMDISEATVVMLYLWPEVNLRLRPKLFAELKPGTRVLSHNHSMGEWKPDQYKKIGKHGIYFWLIPANIAGSWTWPLQTGIKTTDAILRLNQNFQEITGTLTIDKATVPIRDTQLRGSRLSLSAEPEINGKRTTVKLNGQTDGNALLGTMAITGSGAGDGIPWHAKRGQGNE